MEHTGDLIAKVQLPLETINKQGGSPAQYLSACSSVNCILLTALLIFVAANAFGLSQTLVCLFSSSENCYTMLQYEYTGMNIQ